MIVENKTGMAYSSDNHSKAEIDSAIALDSILQRAKDRDPDAEHQLFCTYSAKLVRLASSRISNSFNSKIDPEDIVQSVLRSFFSRHQKDQLTFDSWDDLWRLLVCMTVRKCNTKIKRALRLKRSVNREVNEADFTSGKSLFAVSPEPTPLQAAIISETLEQLLDPLTKLQRNIVYMKLQGYSNRQISEQLDRTERTVYRTTQLLRERMQLIINTQD